MCVKGGIGSERVLKAILLGKDLAGKEREVTDSSL